MGTIDGQVLAVAARQDLFANVPTEVLESLLAHCQVLRLERGGLLLAAGQTNAHLYVLLAGQLNVHVVRGELAEGFVIAPGECIGEISIIDGQPTTAQVVADRPSQVLAIPEPVFWEQFLALPGMAKNFIRLFASRFRARNEAMRLGLEQQLRYQHLQKELAIARDIQCGMLPCQLDFTPEIDIAAEMLPASHVGGDFFDAFPLGHGDYCVAIGDIAGKGVPAALFVVRAMTLLRTEMLKGQLLNEMLCNLNSMLCRDNPTDMFATLSIGVINVPTGRLTYANAGHHAIAYAQRGAAYGWLPRPQGILVGIDVGANYGEAALELRAGDTLVFSTDGITEAMNRQHELFTSQRLLACLDGAPVGSAQDLVDYVKREVRRFVGDAPQSDDFSLLVVRYQGCTTAHSL